MINWKKIQNFYDDNHTWSDIRKEFGISYMTILKNSKNGNFKSRNKSEAMKLLNKLKPKKLSEDTKKKISDSRIKFLKENPDKVPYLVNHSSSESYPEKYFNEILKKTDLKYKRYCSVNLYQLDFAFIEKGIDLEIDGEQHYLDDTIINSNKRRDEYLKNEGWDILRVRWSFYKKLNKEEQKIFIENILKYLNDKNDLPIIPHVNKKNNYNLCDCGNKKWFKSKKCKICSSKKRRKFEITKEELKKLLEINSYEALGRKFGVSGNAIKKRSIKYGLIPS